ncbi:15466_t:CDS:2, partial [Cetraspora pellucida]
MNRYKQQSLAESKLQRLVELNQRLRRELDHPRIRVSEASNRNTRDFLVPSVWGSVDRRDDPYASSNIFNNTNFLPPFDNKDSNSIIDINLCLSYFNLIDNDIVINTDLLMFTEYNNNHLLFSKYGDNSLFEDKDTSSSLLFGNVNNHNKID